jgi:hypothetical protein
LDDTLLTPSGTFPQPANTTPILAGFYHNARLFRLLGEVLTCHKSLPPTKEEDETLTYTHLNLRRTSPGAEGRRDSREFFDELERILEDLPGPLRLIGVDRAGQVDDQVEGHGGGGKKIGDSSDEAGFATCRANLLVTQAMVRFAIRRYARAAGERELEDGMDGDGSEGEEGDIDGEGGDDEAHAIRKRDTGRGRGRGRVGRGWAEKDVLGLLEA